MTISKLSRTITFRLTLLYSIFFAICVASLLSFIYWQTTGDMIRRVDHALNLEKENFLKIGNARLPGKIDESLGHDLRHIRFYALFDAKGNWIAGNIRQIPPALPVDETIYQLSLTPKNDPAFPITTRALACRIAPEEILVIGRDVGELVEFHQIIKNAFYWGGSLTMILGIGFGLALSIRPLRRIEEIQRVCKLIMQGDFKQRLPTTSSRDELDMLAAIINTMLDSVERLMSEVKSVCDNIAHDLRTPLTRLRAFVYRGQQQLGYGHPQQVMLDQALCEIDSLLSRFRALLRISEIENGQRRAGFKTVHLQTIMEQAVVFFEPVAEDKSIDLALFSDNVETIQGDAELLFEAVVNLLDNAIKFTPPGGKVSVKLLHGASGPRIDILDTGPGIEDADKKTVLYRFYRSANSHRIPGYGLGLSIVIAITQLHDFEFKLSDAEGGTCATICCWPTTLQKFVE